jgi:hypothetical protein
MPLLRSQWRPFGTRVQSTRAVWLMCYCGCLLLYRASAEGNVGPFRGRAWALVSARALGGLAARREWALHSLTSREPAANLRGGRRIDIRCPPTPPTPPTTLVANHPVHPQPKYTFQSAFLERRARRRRSLRARHVHRHGVEGRREHMRRAVCFAEADLQLQLALLYAPNRPTTNSD